MKKAIVGLMFVFVVNGAFAQFINSMGAMVGATYASQRWHYVVPDNTTNLDYVLGFNGCFFLEFFQHDFIRWRSEIQFNQKGGIEKAIDAQGVESKLTNKFGYLSWNNFLVIRYELLKIIPYILGGPRVDYLVTNSPQSPMLMGTERGFHFSWSVGAGVEWVMYGKWKPMVEAHYNYDFDYSHQSSLLEAKNRAFELRVGVKYVFLDDRNSCPPVYTLLD